MEELKELLGCCSSHSLLMHGQRMDSLDSLCGKLSAIMHRAGQQLTVRKLNNAKLMN